MKQFIIIFFLLVAILPDTWAQHKIVINEDVVLIPLQDSIYLHVTYETHPDYGRFSSNGVVAIKNGKALWIDTPMDEKKTTDIFNYLKDSMQVETKILLAGHFHDDCVGGMEFLQTNKVLCITNKLTSNKLKELKEPLPDSTFTDSLYFDFNGLKVECFFPGGGHTFDNIVVYFPDKQLLFGGCLIKSKFSKSMGNLSDAVVEDWEASVEKVEKQFPLVNLVVPGHGPIGGKDILAHTRKLIKEYLEKQEKENE